jgi:hypothetical protein
MGQVAINPKYSSAEIRLSEFIEDTHYAFVVSAVTHEDNARIFQQLDHFVLYFIFKLSGFQFAVFRSYPGVSVKFNNGRPNAFTVYEAYK